jgi:hypothetical protein
MTRSIPTQLTKLFLGSVTFSQDPPSGSPLQYLPVLRTLELQDVVFDGPIQNYFHCPKLVELSYRYSEAKFVHDGLERKRQLYRGLAQGLFDESFFRGVPNLECIRLHGLILDGVFAGHLQSCPLLHKIRLKDCRIKEFIISFGNSISDEKRFPSLKVLRIDDSWPAKLNASYEQFQRFCRSKRPQLWITGNEQIDKSSQLSFLQKDCPSCGGNHLVSMTSSQIQTHSSN